MKKNNEDQNEKTEKNTIDQNLTYVSDKWSGEALALVKKIEGLAIYYMKKQNISENKSFGIYTVNQIRQGMLFRFQKILLKKRYGKNWIKWFSDNSDKRHFYQPGTKKRGPKKYPNKNQKDYRLQTRNSNSSNYNT